MEVVDILQQELIRAGVFPEDYDFDSHKELVHRKYVIIRICPQLYFLIHSFHNKGRKLYHYGKR